MKNKIIYIKSRSGQVEYRQESPVSFQHPIHWLDCCVSHSTLSAVLFFDDKFFFLPWDEWIGEAQSKTTTTMRRRAREKKSHSASASSSIFGLMLRLFGELQKTHRDCVARGQAMNANVRERKWVFFSFLKHFPLYFILLLFGYHWNKRNTTQFLMLLARVESSGVVVVSLLGLWVDEMMMIPTKHSIALWSIISTMRTIIRPRDGAPTDDFVFGFQFVKMDYITGYLLACGEGSERSIFIIFCSFLPLTWSSLRFFFGLIWSHATRARCAGPATKLYVCFAWLWRIIPFHSVPTRCRKQNMKKKPNLWAKENLIIFR